MRPATILGVLLILAGAFVLVNGGSFTTRRDVVRLGDLKISAEERHPVRPWMAGLAILGGVTLVVVGARRKA
jgi:drug/metabolite transporter (DMT)-like permease